MRFEGEHGVISHFLIDVNNRLDDDTLKSYRLALGYLVKLLGARCSVFDLEQVTILHLRQCLHFMSQAPSGRHKDEFLAVSTIRTYTRVWKVFFNWCFQEELIDKNPASRLTLPRPDKRIVHTFQEEHIQQILASFDLATDMGFRDYVIILLLLDTGIRLAEISTLRLSDVHDTYIKVMGKGRKEREIGLHPDVGKLLWKYVHKYRHPADIDEPMLFISVRGGGALERDGVRSLVERVKDITGIEDVRLSPHTFRHTFAKMYIEHGGEVFKLSREMGHSDIQTTEKYLEDFTSTQARKEHHSYSPINFIVLNRSKRKKEKS